MLCWGVLSVLAMELERNIALQTQYFAQLNNSERLRLLEGSHEEILRKLHSEAINYFNQTVMEEVSRMLGETETKAVTAWDGYLGFVNAVVGFFDEIHPGETKNC